MSNKDSINQIANTSEKAVKAIFENCNARSHILDKNHLPFLNRKGKLTHAEFFDKSQNFNTVISGSSGGGMSFNFGVIDHGETFENLIFKNRIQNILFYHPVIIGDYLRRVLNFKIKRRTI